MACGNCESSAQLSAAAAVLLPMPISPPTNSCVPQVRACAMLSAPAASASRNCAGVIAACSQILAHAGAIQARRTRDNSPGSLTTPRFTTSSRAPSSRASTAMAAPPRAKLRTISPVTACGNIDTPSAATPWSAAYTAIQMRCTVGCSLRCQAANCTASCSSRPSAPGGLVNCSCRASAAACTRASGTAQAPWIHSILTPPLLSTPWAGRPPRTRPARTVAPMPGAAGRLRRQTGASVRPAERCPAPPRC